MFQLEDVKGIQYITDDMPPSYLSFSLLFYQHLSLSLSLDYPTSCLPHHLATGMPPDRTLTDREIPQSQKFFFVVI